MREYRFDYNKRIAAGRVVFLARNAGRVEHQLRLIPLADDVLPIGEQLGGSERRIVTPFAGMPAQRPGKTAAFAVDLLPGRRYALVCFIVDPDGQSHALRGMASEFRTLPAVGSIPAADGTKARS